MHLLTKKHKTCWVLLFFFGISKVAIGQNDTSDQHEFFETRIRPVLVEQCYSCHNSFDTAEADVALDSRDAIRSESSLGTIVVPGKADESVLLKVIRHEVDGLEMPEDGPRLSDATIADFEKWIQMNAPDPRDKPPTQAELQNTISWESKFERRKQWWSFQPLEEVPVPSGNSEHPIDRFLNQKLAEEGLSAATQADRRTILRRLSYVLTGLPPAPAELQAFMEDASDDAFDLQVERLLKSERFGERWARHWMDWVRYADSHGSEGDPAIPNAYRYRDYLIRAINADVPYDQLLKEHVAGDLLPEPRLNQALGLNESAIGPAHWRMVFHGFAPTDALDEKVRFTDDMINVFSKAFQGLTVSCARCHDHKFDAISQADYYALFGVLASCRPALIDSHSPQKQELHKTDLAQLKQKIRDQLADYWIDTVRRAESNLQVPEKAEELSPVQQLIVECWKDDADVPSRWSDWKSRLSAEVAATQENQKKDLDGWDLSDPSNPWFAYGNGLQGAGRAGELMIFDLESDTPRLRILPAGVHANILSTKHSAVFTSPRIMLDEECDVWLLIQGEGKSTVRYAVQNYPRNGTVYPISEINNGQWHWKRFNVKYWQGDEIHLELATAMDAPLQVRNSERSWFGIRQAVLRPVGSAPPNQEALAEITPLLSGDSEPASSEEFKIHLRDTLQQLLLEWKSGELSDGGALLLDRLLQTGFLPQDYPAGLHDLFQRYRDLEEKVPVPQRVPGLAEADAFDQPLFERGNHRRALQPVPRRYLSAIDATPYDTQQSGRLELAANLINPENPLTARVMVNRLWHYTYGEGLVRTPDNFGRLGEVPSHPELLDYLANRFVTDGWSIKRMLAFILSADSWQRSSRASDLAQQRDPDNRWLSHAHVRRLDAESIRDSLLSTASLIDLSMYGPAVRANSDSNRRSVYVASRRNSLDRFLSAFDAPVPFATKGRRDITNVPAQSLTLMNSETVTRIANHWVDQVLKQEATRDSATRINAMFARAMGREPASTELQAFLKYLDTQQQQAEKSQKQREKLVLRSKQLQAQITSVIGPDKEITGPESLEPLTPLMRKQVESLQQQIAELNQQQESLDHSLSEHEIWRGVALAIFNLKEYIYLD